MSQLPFFSVPTSRVVALVFITVTAAALMIGVPAWELLVPGPFHWHVAQPQSWQGGIEALALGVFVASGFYLNRRWAVWLLVVVPAVLYARRHAFDIALIVDVAYLEIVIALGFRIHRWCGSNGKKDSIDYLHAFTTGFVTWSLFAWIASALDVGSIHDLRWLTLAFALLVVLSPHRSPTLCGFLLRRVGESPAPTRAWCGVLAAWLLVLFARSKVAIGFDPRWYGLQAEHVLVPNHSIFEPLGLVSPVHYYPKIFEMWLLPLSALGDATILSGMSILMTLLLLVACRTLMRDAGLASHVHLPVLGLIATLPALTSIAGQPKPDVFAVFFILLSTIAAARIIRKPSLEAACWLTTGVAIACSAKLTAVPHGGILILIAALWVWRSRSDQPSDSDRPLRPALATLLLALTVSGFVVARTWLLTGLPTIGPDPLFKLWKVLGFSLREPAGTLNWAQPPDWLGVPTLIFDELFRPQLLGHIVISWTGNVWLWFAGIALCAAVIIGAPAKSSPNRVIVPMVALMLLTLAMALGVRYMVRGGDGNYFLFGLVPAIVLSATAAFRQLEYSPALGKVVVACIPAFVLFQAGYGFVSGSWSPGTRAFEANFSPKLKGMRNSNRWQLKASGLDKIAEKLSESSGDRRVVGILEESAMFVLPARYEDLTFISFSRPEYVTNAATLLSYMHSQRITCIILPDNTIDLKDIYFSPAAFDAAEVLKSIPLSEEIRDQRYFMVDASRISETDWQAAISLARMKARPGISESPQIRVQH